MLAFAVRYFMHPLLLCINFIKRNKKSWIELGNTHIKNKLHVGTLVVASRFTFYDQVRTLAIPARVHTNGHPYL